MRDTSDAQIGSFSVVRRLMANYCKDIIGFSDDVNNWIAKYHKCGPIKTLLKHSRKPLGNYDCRGSIG